VAIPRDDLATSKNVLDILTDIILGPGLAELILKIEEELEALLVGKTVKGSSKSVHTSREGKVWVGEG
jgi:hypothetical protein